MSFQWSNVPVDFYKFLPTEFAACSKPPQAEITIVKHLVRGRNNVTRMRVEPISCDHVGRKNDAFALSATLPTY